MSKNKTFKITFRLTEEEADKLSVLMALENFKSRSRYIRHVLFDSRLRRRNLHRTDANITKQIELLRMEIKRIGVNYNQVVKTLNGLSNVKDKRGNPVLTSHSIDGSLSDMRTMMIAILQKVDLIEKEVGTEDNHSCST